MSSKGMTTMEVKKINKHKVYTYIYDNMRVSKQDISDNLQMGLSTITQNLKLLKEEGLICQNGFYQSTGGRKAYAIEINPTARIAIGVDILKEMVHLTAVDLRGRNFNSCTLQLPFSPAIDYYKKLGDEICLFIKKNQLDENKILGVSIAIQGIISTDGQSVSYGIILNDTGLKLQELAMNIPYPCRLEHDSKAAAYLELWSQYKTKDATVILLNRNLGGAIIMGGKVHNGLGMHSGALEHLCLDPSGPACYCGKKGCLETYCSADSLQKNSGMDIISFFKKLRQGDTFCAHVWNDFLVHLGFAIRNLTTILDQTVILSGYLAPYLTDEDIAFLTSYVQAASSFPVDEPFLVVSGHGQLAPATGAALFYIEDFLQGI
jgi:N-acetylglucosamine repressor